ncbi:class D sortase [Anaerolentibacter hominis]|uniref:class D sortase n=1 Tax=Anaerolentibacter hominis TaxID=3079009 RepID=UPI0031B867C8
MERRNRIKRFLGPALIILGTLLLFANTVCRVYVEYQNDRAIRAFRAIQAPGLAADDRKTGEKPDENDIGGIKKARQAEVPAGETDTNMTEGVLGILNIPAIDLTLAVSEGSGAEVLRCGLGHMEGTALPGEQGNFVVAGHRNYAYGSMFNRLNELSVNDIIKYETENTVYTYEVSNILIVEPDQIEVTYETEQEMITLITCTPLYIGTQRLIVQASLMQTEHYEMGQ